MNAKQSIGRRYGFMLKSNCFICNSVYLAYDQNSPVLSSYYQRIQQGKTKSELDTARYTLPTPANTNDIEEWRKAVDNSKAQLEHSNLR